MSRRIKVHHFVAAATVTQTGQHPTSSLLGVDFIRDVPANAEFPSRSPQIDLFTRFYLRRANPTDFSVLVLWTDSPDLRRRLVWHSPRPYHVDFRPDEVVRDHVFRIHSLQLPGVGRYRLVLARSLPIDWKGRTLQQMAFTHFVVER